MTSFRSGELNITIDFERPAARWVLLVIDDMWHSVRHMALGANEFSGLREQCVDLTAVKAYWAARRRGNPEPFLNALMLLVPLAWRHDSISKIVFSAFPPYLTSEVVKSAVTGRQRVAAMLDVYSEAGAEDQHGLLLENSWSLLEETEICPRWARVIFSRAFEADAHEELFRDVPLLSKHLAGTDEFEAAFARWWASVEGDLRTGALAFSDCTVGQYTHEARTLLKAEESAIQDVLATMKPLDSFGVWAWCKEALPERGLELQRRWFAAKVFQTAGALGSSMPVVGLVALLNGTRMASLGGMYSITEGQETTAVREISFQDIDIPDRDCLGVIELGERKCQGFACALRAWLLHPEQFRAGNSRATEVSIGILNERICMTIVYSQPLPEALLPNHSDELTGSGRMTLKELSDFCDSWNANESRTALALYFRIGT